MSFLKHSGILEITITSEEDHSYKRTAFLYKGAVDLIDVELNMGSEVIVRVLYAGSNALQYRKVFSSEENANKAYNDIRVDIESLISSESNHDILSF